MKKHPFLVALGVALLLGVVAVALTLFDFGFHPFQPKPYGNFAGGPRKASESKPIALGATKFGIRWFPDYVHFGPDGDTLLVSLCHVKRSNLCRIGKYSISKNHWDILPFEENRTYYNPVFSPDGQWIVATRTSIDEESRLTREEFRLIKMRPDGSGVQSLISAGVDPPINEKLAYYQKIDPGSKIQAIGATFSHDGKKLIYWRMYDNPGKPTFEIHLMDWATGVETRLTEFHLGGAQSSRPFLTPDGEKFVFAAVLSNRCVKDGKMVSISSIMAARIKDIPLTCKNVQEKVEVLWPNELRTDAPLDMDRQGRVLYAQSLEMKKKEGNPVALAIRPANPEYKQDLRKEQAIEKAEFAKKLSDEDYRRGEGIQRFFRISLRSQQYQQGGGTASFLRKPNVDAQDELAFDFAGHSASVSPDSQRLAFASGGPAPFTSLSLLKLGEPMRNVRFLDWPKLELVSSSAQPHVKP